MRDPMLEEIWRVRDELIRRHGGVHGFLKYLQSLDRKRPVKAKRTVVRKRTASGAQNGRATRRGTVKI